MHGTNGRTAVQFAPDPCRVARVYFDDDFRDRMVTRATDPIVARFWRNEVAVTNARKRQCKSEADLNPASTSEDGALSVGPQSGSCVCELGRVVTLL
jgi:hypothetical protein